ncbi:MAG: ABC-F family ATP-binding cassette domain-containing protein [Deltaproteobacteria bacterium]|nr:ABC-F family ATP-binding cassette domain-containing protein [Deltaproteobacteria bacterium]
MIKVTGLTKSFSAQTIFDDASFTLGAGERVGLVGRNGHGKTTLFRIILDEMEYDDGLITMPRHYKIGHLSQHLSFTENFVIDEACLALPHCEDGIDRTYKVKIILAGLGISEDQFYMSPSELSGGYQVRLNLAKALVAEPNLLLLDEPTNYLDIVSIRWLQRFLRKWRGEIMLITHDREFMDSVSTHTLSVHRHKFRKVEGSTAKLYGQTALEEEIHEKTRVNLGKRRAETEEFINRFRATASKAVAVQSRIKMLEKTERLEKLDTIKDLDFAFKSAPFEGKNLIEVKDLSFGYSEDELLINGLSFSIGKKDRIAVIGKNGKGKTTLLNLLAAELKPVKGSVTAHQALKRAYFGQTNVTRLNPSKTVEEELIDTHHDCTRAMARRIAGLMMFVKDNALKRIDVLSGGEKSRVLLGKLLVSPANLLLLDEPTNHLDMHSIDSLVDAVTDFSGAVVMVTHSEMILNAVANRLIVFDAGRVEVFEGTYAEFLEKTGWQDEAETNAGGKLGRGKKNGKGMNPKELRRERAQAGADKTGAPAAIKARINSIEDGIVRLEAECKKTEEALAAASEKGDVAAIAELSMNYREIKEKIDMMFEELSAQSAEFESKTKEFEFSSDRSSGQQV